MKILINLNVESDKTINNDKLNQSITDLKVEFKQGHERYINDMTQVDEYKSTRKNKDASTINNSAYYESDEQEVEISDSIEQVEASKEPITDTHSIDRVRNLSDGVVSVESDMTGFGIIG